MDIEYTKIEVYRPYTDLQDPEEILRNAQDYSQCGCIDEVRTMPVDLELINRMLISLAIAMVSCSLDTSHCPLTNLMYTATQRTLLLAIKKKCTQKKGKCAIVV